MYYSTTPSRWSSAHRAQICVKGVTRISTFGISVDPDVWSGSRVSKGTYRNSKRLTGAEINKRLNNIENHFMDWDNQLTRRPTKDEIKEQLEKALGKEEETAPAPIRKAYLYLPGPLQWHPAAGCNEMDRPLRLQVHEAVYRHCRQDQVRRHEHLRQFP